MQTKRVVAVSVVSLLVAAVCVVAGWQVSSAVSSRSDAVPMRVPADPVFEKYDKGVIFGVTACVDSVHGLGAFSGGQYVDYVKPVDLSDYSNPWTDTSDPLGWWIRSAECIPASINQADLLVAALPESTRPAGDFVRTWKVRATEEGEQLEPDQWTQRVPVWVRADKWPCTVFGPEGRFCESFPASNIVVPEGVS